MAAGDQPLTQVKNLWSEMTPGRRLTTIGLVIGTLAVMGLLVWQAQRANMRVLYSGLDQSASSSILEELRSRGVRYDVSSDGTMIRVPSDQMAELRVDLSPLVRGNTVGFDIFDQSTLGWTDFMQRVNHVRALQGELTATLRQYDVIESARVHITLPEEDVFVAERRDPTASVAVRMQPGQRLSERQVESIVQLVAAAVPDLISDNVSVVDTARGISLTPEPEDSLAAQVSNQERLRRSYEQSREQKIVGVLEPVVGHGNVIATVAATFDFTQQVTEAVTLDRPQAAITVTETEMDGAGTAQPGGTLNSMDALTDAEVTQINESGGHYRQVTQTQNEIPRTTTSTQQPGGDLVRQTASVMIHHRRLVEPAEGEDEEPTVTYEAWTPEELARFEALVQSAIEFSTDRGDTVTVANMEFFEPAGGTADDASEYAALATRNWITSLVKMGLFALAGLILFLMVIRPVTREVLKPVLLPETSQALLGARVGDLQALTNGGPAGQLEGEGDKPKEPGEGIEIPEIKDEGVNSSIRQMTEDNPSQAAEILKGWLGESGS